MGVPVPKNVSQYQLTYWMTDLMITWTIRSEMISVSSAVLLLPVKWMVDGC